MTTPQINQVLADAVKYADENELLMDRPWRLGEETTQKISDQFGYTPPGGWNSLIGLSCGFGLFKTDGDYFEPRFEPNQPLEKEPDDIKVALVESYTRKLIPPDIAAATFIFTGIHPVWGLRVAKKLHADRHFGSIPPRDFSDSTEEVIAQVHEFVFTKIADVVTHTTTLDTPTNEDDFVSFLQDVIQDIEQTGINLDRDRDYDPQVTLGLSTDEQRKRAAQGFFDDFVDKLLVTAQIAEYEGDDIYIDQDLLSEARID